jgi:hypothetical protein
VPLVAFTALQQLFGDDIAVAGLGTENLDESKSTSLVNRWERSQSSTNGFRYTCNAMRHSTALRIVRSPFSRLNGVYLAGFPAIHPVSRSVSTSSANDLIVKKAKVDTSVNAPASTRPPPLALPARDPEASAISYYFQLGKAYVAFYKSGLKAVLTNRTLKRELLERTPQAERPSVLRPYQIPSSFSRADWVLIWRVRHDLLRLPMFGLVLLVCGEFTPLVVIFVDGVVPYTCRLPRQIGASMEKAEVRRANSFQQLGYQESSGQKLSRRTARAHVLRSLHLVGNIWDRVGWVPSILWHVKGTLRMAFLEGDDRLLLKAGGVSRLEPEEVKIACAERGIGVLGRKDGELRQLLGDWLRLTAADELEERRKRMTVLLTKKYVFGTRLLGFAADHVRLGRRTGPRTATLSSWTGIYDRVITELVVLSSGTETSMR